MENKGETATGQWDELHQWLFQSGRGLFVKAKKLYTQKIYVSCSAISKLALTTKLEHMRIRPRSPS